jgi:O-antigen ligase
MINYLQYSTKKITKNRVASLLTLFLLSTTFNHKMFFINVGDFSLRPYMLVASIGIVYMILSKKRIYLTKNQLIMLLLMFLFFIIAFSTYIISPYVSDSPTMFFRGIILLFFQLFIFLFIFMISNHIHETEALNAISITLNFILIVASILYIYHIATKGLINYGESYLGILYSYQGRPRLMGTVGDPNYFSLYITVYYWLYLFFARKLSLKTNKLTSVFFMILILLTQSRTAIIINILALLLLFSYEVYYKTKVTFLTLIGLILTGIPIFFVLDRYILNINDLFLLSEDASFGIRSKLLFEGLKNIYRHPFGVGIGYLQSYYVNYLGLIKVAHNDFISVFIEIGVLGVIMYISLYIFSFYKTNIYGKIIILIIFGYAFALTMYYFDPILVITFAFILTSFKRGR